MQNPFRRRDAYTPDVLAALEARGADPAAPWGDSTPPSPAMGSGGALSSVVVNDNTALQVVAVKTCVSILADAVATLPMYAYRLDANRVSRRVAKNPELLERPYYEITRQDWLTQVMVSLLLRGNAYGWISERDAMGNASQVQVLHPDQVRVSRNQTKGSPRFGQKEYKVGGQLAPPDSIMHVMGISAPGSLIGMNPIADARTSIALTKSTEAYGANFFENSAQASGVISVDGDLTEDNAKVISSQWMAAHQGVNKAHLPAVLAGGAKWTTISINPDDAQFLQTRDFQRHDIAMLFRIPEHMLGIQDRTSSWGTGIEQMMIGFVIDTLRPWLTRIESAMSDLLPNEADRISFDLSGRLRGDTEQRFNAYSTAINNGWLCVDEVRDKEDLPPLPDGLGQRFFQSVQSIPAGTTPPGQQPPSTPALVPDTAPDGPS